MGRSADADTDDWLEQLRCYCAEPSPLPTRASDLALPDATDLLILWLQEARSYTQLGDDDWKSVQDDFRDAYDAAGPLVRKALEPHQDPLRSATDRVTTIDRVRSGVRGSLKVEEARAILSSPSGLQAAWDDLVAACQDPAMRPERVVRRSQDLWQSLSSLGHDIRELRSIVKGVLRDEVRSVDWARYVAGENRDVPMPDGHAGLTAQERISLVRNLLSAPSQEAHNIVWFAFDRARLRTTDIRHGPITLWDGEWVRENLVNSGPNVPYLPAELREKRLGFRPEDLPQGRDVVLVQVDLGQSRIAEAVRAARRVVGAVLGAAVPYAGSHAWRMLEGYVHFAGDVSTSVHFFRHPDEERPSDYGLNALAEVLNARLGRLRPEAIRSSDQLRQLLDGMSRWREAERAPLLDRIILDVRSIGLVTSQVERGRLSWNDFLDRYMAEPWSAAEISRYIDETVRGALSRTIWGTIDDGLKSPSAAEGQHWAELVDGGSLGGEDRLRFDRALPELDSIIADYDRRDSVYGALLGIRIRLHDAAESRIWVDAVRKQFALRVSRLKRERNMIGHGGPIHEPSVHTVAGLSQDLAFVSLDRAVGGLLRGQTVEEELRALGQAGREWLAELRAGRITSHADWGPA